MEWSGPDEIIHGVLVSVFRRGVLITGESGVGKSKCALELIAGGHRLVADDVVELRTRDGRLFGAAPDRFLGLIGIREKGICDVRDLFGERFVQRGSEIDLWCHVEKGDAGDRLPVHECSPLRTPDHVFPGDSPETLSSLILKAVRDHCGVSAI
jgi:HPr kinase/phosphorylase